MDRNLVYAGSIPLDTDLLAINRNTMVAVGYLAQAALGTATVADGLACTPTSPASLAVQIGPGSITQLAPIDAVGYAGLGADATDTIVKMGINIAPTILSLAAPGTPGQAIAYLIQASFAETDAGATVLPYYNAANPAQPFSGPGNSGAAQNTQRIQRVQLLAKAGAAASAGAQALPPVDNGWVGLYSVIVTTGQLTVSSGNIALLPSAPFIGFKLPQLRPGFGSGVQVFVQTGTFVVPAGVTQVEVEVWGGGSGTYASTAGQPSGGGSGGGYARRRVTGLSPGSAIAVIVGAGGSAGLAGGAPQSGGTSSFGPYASSTGGAAAAGASAPGGPGGSGYSGDFIAQGGTGGPPMASSGGIGAAAPFGAMQSGATTGVNGIVPGGGASGASGNAAYNGGQGANGCVIVRW